MKRRLKLALHATLATLAGLAASCATRQRAPLDSELGELVPQQWSEASGSTAPFAWPEAVSDGQLAALVEEAEARNFGLEAAYQRQRAAEAAARIARALRYPSVSADLRSSRNQSLLNFAPPRSSESETHALNLSARWEVDLWNRLGLQANAARSEYQASQYDFQYFRLSLASQVARLWFNAIEAKTQYELAAASARSFETNLASLERRYARGLVDAFDLRLIRAQAAASRASALARRNQLDTEIRALETLLGRYPAGKLQAAEALPELDDAPAAGIPSELLARRPDILAQEERLAAAFARETAGRRNWLPSLALTGSSGTLSPEFSDLLESDFSVWSLAADLTAPLFQGGRLEAQRDQLNANQLAQLAQYKDLVLTAFREVESALRAETDLRQLEAQTRLAAAENRSAEAQAWNLYERGLIDITAVLDAQRRSFDTRSQLISTQNQRLQNRISLHLALGGDFQP